MPDGDEGKGEETDLDKLRSEYDTREATLNKEVEELRGRLSQMESRGQSDTDYAAIVTQLNSVDTSDPDKAVEDLKAIALGIANNFVTTKGAHKYVENLFKETLADKLAIEIAHEHGGDPKTYAKELLTATTRAAMTEKAQILKDKVALDKARTPGNGRTERSEQAYRVDEGRGRAVRTDVLQQIGDFDPWTPEGQAEWAKQEKEIKRKVDAAGGRR